MNLYSTETINLANWELSFCVISQEYSTVSFFFLKKSVFASIKIFRHAHVFSHVTFFWGGGRRGGRGVVGGGDYVKAKLGFFMCR